MIKKSKKEPTIQDLVNLINGQADFMMKQFAKIDDRFNKMEDKISEFKDGIYNKMDAVYKEVLDFRNEQVMHQGGHDRLQKIVDGHEKRLTKLEKPHITAHKIKH